MITNVPFYVDNEDHYDFVLFTFSERVEITSARVTPSLGTFNLDASVWLENVSSDLDLTGASLAELLSVGFGLQIDNDAVASNSLLTFGVLSLTGWVNALLIGARIGGDSLVDRFKIFMIQGTTVIPEPSPLRFRRAM